MASIWDQIGDALQKPQALYEGATAGLSNQFARYYGKKKDEDELTKMFKDLEDSGVDVAEFEHLRPLAQTFLGGIRDAWNRDDVTPQRMAQQAKPVDEWDDKLDTVENILGIGANVVQDPSLVLGQGVAGKIAAKGGKIGAVGQGATRFGKVEKGAGVPTRVGQAARYGVQGLIGSGGDPMGALMTGSGIALGERALSPLVRAAGSRLAGRGGKELLGLPGPTYGPQMPAGGGGSVVPPKNYAGPEAVFDDLNVSQAFKTGSGAARADLPVEMRALGPGTPTSGQPIPSGPVGSTGAEGNMDRIMEMISGQPKALPPAFGTSGGMPMGPAPVRASAVTGSSSGKITERDLLQFLREEARRLRG